MGRKKTDVCGVDHSPTERTIYLPKIAKSSQNCEKMGNRPPTAALKILVSSKVAGRSGWVPPVSRENAEKMAGRRPTGPGAMLHRRKRSLRITSASVKERGGGKTLSWA